MKKYLIAVLIVLVAVSACKKDKDEKESPYMAGALQFSIPKYLLPNQEVEVTASGITDPTENITYTWYVTGFIQDTIIGQTIKLNTKDTIGYFSVSVTATHADFPSRTYSLSTNIIDPNSTESFSGISSSGLTITDPRDSQTYNIKKYGNLYWFVENLKWKDKGYPYEKEQALTDIYGYLYTWDQATGGVSATGLGNGPQGVCPPGWSIPTKEDWVDFAKYNTNSQISFDNEWIGLGENSSISASLNGNSIWRYSPDNQKKNSNGFNALPGGSTSNEFRSFTNMYTFGFWWSSTEHNSNSGLYRYIHFDRSAFPYNFANKSQFAASVRCVKLAN